MAKNKGALTSAHWKSNGATKTSSLDHRIPFYPPLMIAGSVRDGASKPGLGLCCRTKRSPKSRAIKRIVPEMAPPLRSFTSSPLTILGQSSTERMGFACVKDPSLVAKGILLKHSARAEKLLHRHPWRRKSGRAHPQSRQPAISRPEGRSFAKISSPGEVAHIPERTRCWLMSPRDSVPRKRQKQRGPSAHSQDKSFRVAFQS